MRSLRPPHAARSAGLPRPQRGIALIMVLWLTVLIAVIGSSFAYSMRGEALAARNTMSLAQARAAADGAVERTFFELSRPRVTPEGWWAADGQPHTFNEGDIALTVVAYDESARIDLNSAAEPLLKGLLQNIGGLDPDTAQRTLEAILDWKDADDLRHPNGAEAPDYQAAGSKYVPTNAPFESVGELARVLGMTPAVSARLVPTLTVYSRQAGVNVATAGRDVLLAMPAATAEQVDAFIAARDEARKSRLPMPPFPPAQAFAAGASPVFRIHVVARTADGVTFARDAVVRSQPDPRRPLVTLLWQEGVQDVAGPAPANETSAQQK